MVFIFVIFVISAKLRAFDQVDPDFKKTINNYIINNVFLLLVDTVSSIGASVSNLFAFLLHVQMLVAKIFRLST